MKESFSRILVTGGAGFIGSHLVDSLLLKSKLVVVLDNFNPFYDPSAKRQNVANHLKLDNYVLIEGDLRDQTSLNRVFEFGPFDVVVHLAAMAGVRPSLNRPAHYMDVNVLGTQLLVEKIIASSIKTRLIFGSSSSVYGARSGESFLETDRIDQPLSPYAASKAAGEMLCYSAFHTMGLKTSCLRFFTVFGPRQRPDLAIHKFCQLIDSNQEIEVFGDGTSKRDYTFVADIVQGIEKSMTYELPGFDIINLGRGEPIILMDMIKLLENALGKSARLSHKSTQLGDMPYTFASISKAQKVLGFRPVKSFPEGIKEFVYWYQMNKTAMEPLSSSKREIIEC